MSEDTTSVGCGCWSIVGLIVCVLLILALIFGVTVGGQHYSLGCDGNAPSILAEPR